MVISNHVNTSQVSAELTVASDEADNEMWNAKRCNSQPNPVLYVFGRGYVREPHTVTTIT